MDSVHRAGSGGRRASLAFIGAAVALALGLWALLHLVGVLRPTLFVAFAAVLVAFALDLPLRWLARRLPRPVAALIVGAGLLGLFAASASLVVPLVERQAHALVEMAPRAVDRLAAWADRSSFAGGAAFGAALRERLGREAGALLVSAVPVALGAVKAAGTAIVVVVLGIYLAYRPETYQRGLLRLVPRDREATAQELLRRVGHTLRGWVGGTLVSMAAVGALMSVGMLVLGLDTWLVLGVFAFIGEFVPYLGPILSAVPAVAAGLVISPVKGLEVAAVAFAIQEIEGHVLVPLVMKRAVKIEPALLIAWQLAVAQMFGVFGLLVATPLLAVVQVAVEYLYVERTLGRAPDAER